MPVGKGTIHEVDNELIVDGRFFTDTVSGDETYKTVKNLDDLTEWSFGFDVVEADRGALEGEPVQFLRSMKVYEVSPVLLGAGINTRTLGVKAAKIDEFPHHNEDGTVDFEAVAKGIAALNGYVKSAKLSGEEREAVYEHLAEHYREFGEEPPKLREETGGGYRGQIAIVRDAVADVALRTREVCEVRRADGRELSDERKAELARLCDELEKAAREIREAVAPEIKAVSAADLLRAMIKERIGVDDDE